MTHTSAPSFAALFLIASALTLACTVAQAQQPLIKNGACPSGYHTSGNYCLASSASSKPAVIKSGSCPSGFHTSGAYCLRN
jgi:hypothetical protein